MRTCVILLMILTFVSGCKCPIVDGNYAAPNFKQTYTAEVKTIRSGYLYEPIMAMWLWKDYIVVKAKSAENKYEFQVLSKENGSHIAGFGFLGRGKNELTLFNNIGFNTQNGHITAVDVNGKFALYDVDKIAESGMPNPEQCYEMPSFPRGRVSELNGKLVHTESIPRIFMTDMKGQDTIGVVRNRPLVSPDIDQDSISHQMYYYYNSNWVARPDGKKMCNVTRYGMIMEIYDSEDESISPTTLRYFFQPKMSSCRSNIASADCVWGATKVSATNKYIYCHYSDSMRGEENSNDYVGVFDWNGREVCRYLLPRRTYDLAVTPDNKYCYIWGHDAEGEEYLGCFYLNHL